MSSNNGLAICIPTWNCRRWLSAAIASALRISPGPVAVVDDGSTDGTWDLLKEFGDRYPALTIARHLKNKGASSARNRALDMVLRCPEVSAVLWADADDTLDTDGVQVGLERFHQLGGRQPVWGFSGRIRDGVAAGIFDYGDQPALWELGENGPQTQAIIWPAQVLREHPGLRWDETQVAWNDTEFLLRAMESIPTLFTPAGAVPAAFHWHKEKVDVGRQLSHLPDRDRWYRELCRKHPLWSIQRTGKVPLPPFEEIECAGVIHLRIGDHESIDELRSRVMHDSLQSGLTRRAIVAIPRRADLTPREVSAALCGWFQSFTITRCPAR